MTQSLSPPHPFDSLALRELLVLLPAFTARLNDTLRPWSGALPLPGGAPLSLDGVNPSKLWVPYLKLLRWRLEARPGVERRSSPALLHPLEIEAPQRAQTRLEPGLQALWGERAAVLGGGNLTDAALTVLWRVLQAARSGTPYRRLPAQREVQALRSLLDATVLPPLSGPVQVCPPVGDLRFGNTLVLLSLSDAGRFPHSHWQMTAAAFVLDTVFGQGELERITWLYPRRQASRSFGPDEVFEVGRGRVVGREFRRALIGTEWTRLRQVWTQAQPGTAPPGLTPVLALHLINRATKETALRRGVLSVPGSAAASEPERIRYLYEMKHRGTLALLDDGLLHPVGFEHDTLLVVGETPYGVKGFHLPLRMTPERFRQVQTGVRRGGSGPETQTGPLPAAFSLEAALSVLVDYLGRRSGRVRQAYR